MRGLLTLALVLALSMLATAADAPADASAKLLCGLRLPCVCELSCVSLEIGCGNCCCMAGGSTDAIVVDFLGPDATVLGTATIAGPWCDPCARCGEYSAPLDKPVNPAAVKYVRVTKPGDDDLCLARFKLRAGYDKGCGKFKWHTLYDCCLHMVLGSGEGADRAIVLM